MRRVLNGLKNTGRGCAAFLTWTVLACVTGLVVGAVAAGFHWCIDIVTAIRTARPWVIWLLPPAGAAIVWLYDVCGMADDRGTNLVLVAVRDAEPVRLRMAPLIFLSTVITHFVGGSSGREGAALQLGGSIAGRAARALRLDEKDQRVMVMCGMAAAFSALFGTPITAAVFAMEVVSVA